MTQRVKLGDIADIRAGYPFRQRIEPVADGTHRVIQIKDIGANHRVNPEGLFRVAMPPSANSYLIEPGDVLFQARGSRNFGAPITEAMASTIASGHLFMIRPRMSILPEYLAWCINQPEAQAYIKSQQRGTYIPLVPKDAVTEMEIVIPSQGIQQSIVELERLRLAEEGLQKAICEKRTRLMQCIFDNLLRATQ